MAKLFKEVKILGVTQLPDGGGGGGKLRHFHKIKKILSLDVDDCSALK